MHFPAKIQTGGKNVRASAKALVHAASSRNCELAGGRDKRGSKWVSERVKKRWGDTGFRSQPVISGWVVSARDRRCPPPAASTQPPTDAEAAAHTRAQGPTSPHRRTPSTIDIYGRSSNIIFVFWFRTFFSQKYSIHHRYATHASKKIVKKQIFFKWNFHVVSTNFLNLVNKPTHKSYIFLDS